MQAILLNTFSKLCKTEHHKGPGIKVRSIGIGIKSSCDFCPNSLECKYYSGDSIYEISYQLLR